MEGLAAFDDAGVELRVHEHSSTVFYALKYKIMLTLKSKIMLNTVFSKKKD